MVLSYRVSSLSSKVRTRTRRWLALAVVGVAVPPAAAAPVQPDAAALPTPNAFVSSLDLECYATQGPTLNAGLTLTHLNPVLLSMGLQPHAVKVLEQTQTCVPVEKNNTPPQQAAAAFVSQVDFACFRLDASPLPSPVSLSLRHLNPVLAGMGLPDHKVSLVSPAQLCLPVAKNGVNPPAEVLRLVQFLDLECYNVNADPHPAFGLALTQLNPQLVQSIPPHQVSYTSTPRQLCVPVQKNAQAIPADVKNVVQWTDLEQFAASPRVNISPVTVSLTHLNPLFSTMPKFPVTLQTSTGLMVPVAKNGAIPPQQ
jgi:hypothetical protein